MFFLYIYIWQFVYRRETPYVKVYIKIRMARGSASDMTEHHDVRHD